MREKMSAPATTTPIFDYPKDALLTRTTWFDQWTMAIRPEFNARVHTAMKRRNMRKNIIGLLREAKNVSPFVLVKKACFSKQKSVK